MLRNADDTPISDRYLVSNPPTDIAYAQSINSATLASSPNGLAGNYAGLLYYPVAGYPCNASYPTNGVLKANLPTGFNLIAIVPIDSCTNSLLVQARTDGAEAIIVYNYTSTASGSLAAVETEIDTITFPVYGIAAGDSVPLVQSLQRYSGNMSQVPFGSNLTAIYDPQDYVRLVLSLDTGMF